ncbi:MAG: hypothetical protein GY765_00065 [bacterium]|nr:hypothetical protein [bacterium]
MSDKEKISVEMNEDEEATCGCDSFCCGGGGKRSFKSIFYIVIVAAALGVGLVALLG